MNRVAELLLSSGEREAHLPATLLYNEGWLLRLILDWFSRQPASDHPLAFLAGSRWYTEALLPSQFRARQRGDVLAESRTHADGVIGHFAIAQSGKGDLSLLPGAEQFVVAEAKLFSPLSSGVKHATTFDQAARNVACMAQVIAAAKLTPDKMQRIGFVLLAPAEQVALGVFESLVTTTSIRAKVQERAAAYKGAKDNWCTEVLEPLLGLLQLSVLSWEAVLQTIVAADPAVAPELTAFYEGCLEHNRPKWGYSGAL